MTRSQWSLKPWLSSSVVQSTVLILTKFLLLLVGKERTKRKVSGGGRPPGMERGRSGDVPKKGALAQHDIFITGTGQYFHLSRPSETHYFKGLSLQVVRKSITWSKVALFQGSGHREDRWK